MFYSVNKKTKEHRANVIIKGIDWFRVEADADGWIEWKGGECPLPKGHLVDIKTRNGSFGTKLHAGMRTFEEDSQGPMMAKDWRIAGIGGDIIAYRPILNSYPEKPVEWNGVGFPSVGAACEALILSESVHKDWVEGVSDGMICLPNGRFGCVFQTKTARYMVGAQDEFRPIHTDRERWIDAAMREGGLRARDGAKEVYGALYDAGLAKMPEGE